MDSSPEDLSTPPPESERPAHDSDEEEEEESEEEDAQTADVLPSNGTLVIRAIPSLSDSPLLKDKRPLSKEAICWTLSSAKPGNGVEQVVPSSSSPLPTETYWQSDGPQPHWMRVQFARRVAISHVCLYLDYSLDESYTPQQIRIQCGMTVQDLTLATQHDHVEFREPSGWCIVPLCASRDALDDLLEQDQDLNDEDEELRPVRAHLVEISILNMHQNGRDTHVRQVQLFGPKRDASVMAAAVVASPPRQTQKQPYQDRVLSSLSTALPRFSTTEMSQFSTIR